MDHFQRLGQPRQYDLDRDALEAAYLERAAAAHPDKVDPNDTSAKRQAMEISSAINEAYRTLRDSVRRAEYLVKLGGIDLDSSDPRTGAPQMPKSFLMEMIEQREQLDDAKAQGPDALDELRDAVDSQMDRVFASAVQSVGGEAFTDAAEHLVIRRYLQRLLDDRDRRDRRDRRQRCRRRPRVTDEYR